MKGLSIRQPWAWLIVQGFKDIENRDWKYAPSYRGPLLIHAPQKADIRGDLRWVKHNIPGWGKIVEELIRLQTEESMAMSEIFKTGGFVGMAYLNDVVEISDSPWFTGKFGFKLRQQQPLKNFIPYKGQLGLFDIPTEIIQKIEPTK